MMMNSPTSISPASSDNEDIDSCIQSILRENKELEDLSKNPKEVSEQNSEKNPVQKANDEQRQLQEIQLDMLVEECQELISKISPGISQYYLQDETTLISEAEQSFSMKKQKSRLEKEYIDLCLQIERQQKELHNFKFKVQVAHKQAQYYTRQIKQKTAILESLESHATKKKTRK